MNNNTFGSHEAICLMITMISTKAWIVAIYISILAIIVFYIISCENAFYLRSFSEEMKTMSFTMSPIGFIMLI